MMEFTTVGGSLITIRVSSINYFRCLERIDASDVKKFVRVSFGNEVADLDVSYVEFKERLEDHERREYYNMEAMRKL